MIKDQLGRSGGSLEMTRTDPHLSSPSKPWDCVSQQRHPRLTVRGGPEKAGDPERPGTREGGWAGGERSSGRRLRSARGCAQRASAATPGRTLPQRPRRSLFKS